jgi:Tol biopolymer transport system component
MAQRQKLWPILTVLAVLLVWMQVSCSNSDYWAITGDKQQEATGSKIVFARGNWKGQELRTDIYVVNPDDTRETRLTQTRERETNPVFSPDGEKIAFQRVYEVQESGSASASASAGPGTSTISEIYVINADGTDLRKLPIESEYQDLSSPVWSPDSKKIAFSVRACANRRATFRT